MSKLIPEVMEPETIDDAIFLWTSSADGSLGTGKILNLPSDPQENGPLSVGTHIITVSVTFMVICASCAPISGTAPIRHPNPE